MPYINAYSVDDVYRFYYKYEVKQVALTVQLTKDNKVVVWEENVSKLRLKQLRNKYVGFLTLEEVMKYTPNDVEFLIKILKFDERDYVYRIVRFCEKFKPKQNFTYASKDKKQCKQINSMRRNVAYWCDDIENIEYIYPKVLIHKDILLSYNISVDLNKFSYIFVYGTNNPDEIHQITAIHQMPFDFNVDLKENIKQAEVVTQEEQSEITPIQ